MKILVTGGAGFIGSHVVDRYIALGHKVVVIDDLSTGFLRNVNKKAKFYKADIRDLKLIEKIFNKEKPRIVNHHAAVSEVAKSLKDPTLTYEVNIIGTANLLILAGEFNVKKFIFASTGGAIYGSPKKLPATESAPPRPLSPYAFSKLMSEKFVEFCAYIYGFDYLIFRYGNIYGPRQNPNGEAGVVAIFTSLIQAGIQPTIFGDGTKTRDYIYIDDIVRTNILGIKKGRNQILNLGCGKEIKDQEVFDTLAEELSFLKPPIYSFSRKGEVKRISLNYNHAKRVLNWQPKIIFREGIKKYIKYVKELRKFSILHPLIFLLIATAGRSKAFTN